MKTVKNTLKVTLIYFLIVLEKIYLLPFSNVKMSRLMDVISDIEKFKTLFTRVMLSTVIYSVIFFVCKLIF